MSDKKYQIGDIVAFKKLSSIVDGKIINHKKILFWNFYEVVYNTRWDENSPAHKTTSWVREGKIKWKENKDIFNDVKVDN